MVRFKVIRGSHLMLIISVLILAAVLTLILLQSNAANPEMDGYIPSNTQYHQTQEAKALKTFASNSLPVQSLQIKIEADKPATPPLHDAPRVLVYHTHTHEAYEQDASDAYEALESWRTADASYSIVRVGAALVDELSKMGVFAVHDITDHELNDIDKAYVRALDTLESYSGEFDLVIDLHRDAFCDGMQLRLETDGEPCAQVMMLVGDGGNYTGDEAPDYEKNLSYARELTTELNRLCSGIARNVTIKQGRFNQHIGKKAALVEIGHNRNTLSEALNSVPYLARGICATLK